MSRTQPYEPRRGPLLPMLLFVGPVVGAFSVIRGVADDIEWESVADALGDLEWWQGPLLFAVLLAVPGVERLAAVHLHLGMYTVQGVRH